MLLDVVSAVVVDVSKEVSTVMKRVGLAVVTVVGSVEIGVVRAVIGGTDEADTLAPTLVPA